ncbi:hypothetical protein M406DRAFT_333759 [Cryphonectria parasitica EP155]|uniref:Uncharacterized protein n=1 Tax=Cryphonectria parasitica (strain ATCC 38755 / EP155) TaxID=660469 RepID=A0A9P5CK55_CRYP1|nr:uncharacterized protein M406DRAFT_333759 [Cryphonectria parasitica EP155]KAF3761703.1 hypothetical protein M406DRAFT_333759 [Cryphonectria parasitica EP155]
MSPQDQLEPRELDELYMHPSPNSVAIARKQRETTPDLGDEAPHWLEDRALVTRKEARHQDGKPTVFSTTTVVSSLTTTVGEGTTSTATVNTIKIVTTLSVNTSVLTEQRAVDTKAKTNSRRWHNYIHDHSHLASSGYISTVTSPSDRHRSITVDSHHHITNHPNYYFNPAHASPPSIRVVAGLVVGAVLSALLLVSLIALCLRRRHRNRSSPTHVDTNGDEIGFPATVEAVQFATTELVREGFDTNLAPPTRVVPHGTAQGLSGEVRLVDSPLSSLSPRCNAEHAIKHGSAAVKPSMPSSNKVFQEIWEELSLHETDTASPRSSHPSALPAPLSLARPQDHHSVRLSGHSNITQGCKTSDRQSSIVHSPEEAGRSGMLGGDGITPSTRHHGGWNSSSSSILEPADNIAVASKLPTFKKRWGRVWPEWLEIQG